MTVCDSVYEICFKDAQQRGEGGALVLQMQQITWTIFHCPPDFLFSLAQWKLMVKGDRMRVWPQSDCDISTIYRQWCLP